MFKNLTMTLVALCTLGLVACGSATSSDPQAETITLKLSQMEDGDLQFCDEATGECHELPYDGECVIVEVDIDPNTGGTCERCITADGEVIDLGCSDSSVGCVLVTLPEPDCVVCAYVNGAIIFSSCVADDEPECYTDADCMSAAGQRGFCFEGQCVYEEGCFDDGDCPAGFQCVFPPTNVDPDDATTTNVGVGTCVPRDIGCQSDADCPSDMMCEMWCYDYAADCAPGSDCMPPPCEGVCVDRPYDPCEDVACPDGSHCEVACWANDGTVPPGEPGDEAPRPCSSDDPNCGGGGFGCEPVCVPDPTFCQSDADCGENEMCEMWCYEPQPGDPTDPNMECDPAAGEECALPPCEGVCVPHIQDPCEEIDLDCGDGRHCEVMCYDYGMPCFDDDTWCGCEPVCVDDPSYCQSDADCGEGEMCEMWCYDMPVDCGPDGVDCMPPPCEGMCVPAVNYCYSNDDCPAGQVCELYTDGMPPVDCDAAGNCDGLWAPGMCVDDHPVECVTDDDCMDGDVWNAACVNGRCEYREQFCMADSDCQLGFACELVDCTDPDGMDCGAGFPGICVAQNTNDCFRTGCSGEICADEHMDSTCEYRPEYACFDLTRCERQADGECGWTLTEDFAVCLEQ